MYWVLISYSGLCADLLRFVYFLGDAFSCSIQFIWIRRNKNTNCRVVWLQIKCFDEFHIVFDEVQICTDVLFCTTKYGQNHDMSRTGVRKPSHTQTWTRYLRSRSLAMVQYMLWRHQPNQFTSSLPSNDLAVLSQVMCQNKSAFKIFSTPHNKHDILLITWMCTGC